MPLSPEDERLLSIRAAAEYLSVSRSTVYKLIRTGELSVVDISNEDIVRPDVRVRLSVITDYIDRHDRGLQGRAVAERLAAALAAAGLDLVPRDTWRNE